MGAGADWRGESGRIGCLCAGLGAAAFQIISLWFELTQQRVIPIFFSGAEVQEVPFHSLGH